MKICFLDSGIGGLSVYSAFLDAVNSLSNELQAKILDKLERVYYFADFEHSPYGEKGRRELTDIILQEVGRLHAEFGCTFFVLSCNTATACAIMALRERYPQFTFVGTEPAIKRAVEAGGDTLIMSTSSTYFYSRLLRDYRRRDGVYFLPLGLLAREIDGHIQDVPYMQKLVARRLHPYKNLGIKNVVLGCTHYLFIKPYIKNVLGDVRFFDSNSGVARRVISLLLRD